MDLCAVWPKRMKKYKQATIHTESSSSLQKFLTEMMRVKKVSNEKREELREKNKDEIFKRYREVPMNVAMDRNIGH